MDMDRERGMLDLERSNMADMVKDRDKVDIDRESMADMAHKDRHRQWRGKMKSGLFGEVFS